MNVFAATPAAPAKRIVLTTVGTHGDVLPFIGLGLQLQSLGYRPAIASSRYFEALVRQHGLDFLPVAPHHDEVLAELGLDLAGFMKRAFDPVTGGAFMLKKMVLPHFERTYAELDAACVGADMLVSQPMTMTAHLIAHKRNLPWRSVVLQPLPLSLMSAHDPAVMSNLLPIHKLHGLLGPRGWSWLMSLSKAAGRSWVRCYDDKARELGIYDKRQHPLYERVFSPQGTVSLFPLTLMRQPLAKDLPRRVSFAGFSYFDGARDGLPPDLRAFLQAGAPPVAFTLGTSVVFNPGEFFEQCSQACEQLGLRAVFLSGQHQMKRPLPPSQIAVPWAAHSALFPLCTAVMHQGGIGTCAQATRAGIPQLIVPHAYDQPDNAARLAALDCALVLKPSRVRDKTLVNALQRLTADAGLRSAARRALTRINPECGTINAARLLDGALRAEAALQARAA